MLRTVPTSASVDFASFAGKSRLVLDPESVVHRHHGGGCDNKQRHRLARAILNAEGKIDEVAGGSKLIRHRLRVNGGLEKR
jgi:hypothetical protein